MFIKNQLLKIDSTMYKIDLYEIDLDTQTLDTL